MKHRSTSLLLAVLVVFACFASLGPWGNASLANLEMPREDAIPNFVASPAASDLGLSASNLPTGTVVIPPMQVAAAAPTKSSPPTVALPTPVQRATTIKPSPTKGKTPPSGSPTRTATATATLTRTPTGLRRSTVVIPRTPLIAVPGVMSRTPTLTPKATVTRNVASKTLTQTNIMLPFVSAGKQITAAQTTGSTDYLANSPDIQTYIPNVQSAEPNLFLGTATTSYDIEVPPGRNGLAPKLSLSYSSAAVDMADEFQNGSFLGMGWSFSTNYIARDTRTSYSLNDDVFSLVMNGAGYDLIKGADGSFHTTQDQYWRISYDTTGDYWTVTTKDGTKYQYGLTGGLNGSKAVEYLYREQAPPVPTQPVIYAWWLEKVTDTHGNQIKYTYWHDSGTIDCASRMTPAVWDAGLYPKTIEYNRDLYNETHFLTEIEFTYSSRVDVRWVRTQYQCAAPSVNWKLDRIDVKTTGNDGITMQLVRQYEFGYGTTLPLFPGYTSSLRDPVTNQLYTGRLALRTITQKGSDGTSPLSTYTVTYGANNRLVSVDNGIGGVVEFEYTDPQVFTDPSSPRRVWAWAADKITGVNITPYSCGPSSYCIDGTGSLSEYAVLRTGQIDPETYYNFVPGTSYAVGPQFDTPPDSSCSVRITLWDGVRETLLRDWWNAPPWYPPYGPGALSANFLLGHDATTVELRLFVNGHCAFFGGSGTLNRTYHRVGQRTVTDGQGGSSAISTYAYYEPVIGPHPRAEYQFWGHSKVTVTEPERVGITEYYFRQNAVQAGRVWQTYEREAGGGHTYTRKENQYGQFETAVSTGCTKDENQCPNPTGIENSYYVYTSATIHETYDGLDTPKRVQTVYTVPETSYGNITQTDEYDEANVLYRRTKQIFYPNTTAWIVDKVAVTQVYTGGTQLASETHNFYDDSVSYTTWPTEGDVTRMDGTTDGINFFVQKRTTFDTYGNPTVVSDALERLTTMEYDLKYQVFQTAVVDPLNRRTTNTYDYRMGKLLTTTDPNGATTSYAYDVFGRTTSIWAPLEQGQPQGPTVKYEYTLGSPRSMVHVQVRNDLGGANTPTYQHAWWYYDGLGRVIQQQSTGLNNTLILVNTAYNRRGQVWRVSNAYAVTDSQRTYQTPDWGQPFTEHFYLGNGREAHTSYPDRTARWYLYSQWTTTITEDNNNGKKSLVDAFGRIVQMQELNQGQPYATTAYSYDVTDHLTRVTDNAGNKIEMNYDWLGRKTKMIDPDLGTWTYQYDNAGNLVRQTDAKSQTTCQYYDALNRLTGKYYQTNNTVCPTNPSPKAVTYAYDGGTNGIGRRTGMSDPSGSTAWSYDLQGRVVAQTNSINGITDSYTTRWTYDAMDRARTMTYPDDETLTMTYNEQTLVKDLKTTLNNYDYVTGSNYNAANQLTNLALGNGVMTNYGYHSQNLRLKTLQTASGATNLQNLQYDYDSVGNVTRLTNSLSNGVTEVSTFGYDHLDRLTSATLTGGASPYSASWGYDPIGNITQSTKDSVPTSYTYDLTRVHAVTQVGTQTFSYDANGNMSNRPGDVLTYDEENRLQQVAATNGTTTVYAYNGDGQRVKREVGDSAGWTTTFYVGNWLEVQTSTQAAPTPTNTPLPTNTATRTNTPPPTPTPTNTPTQTPTPIPTLPGSGTLQTQTDFVIGNTIWRAFWRGDQGWYRTIPIVNGVIQWGQASAWIGPYAISTNMPGSGTLQMTYDIVLGSTLWQTVWRGDQGWRRTVPIVNGAPNFDSASAWAGPYSISGQPGSGALETQSDYVVGGTYWQYLWRGDQGWYRYAPIVNGAIQWGSVSAWAGPYSITGQPGSGTLQAESGVVLGATLWQYVWRGGQEWSRSVPIINEVPQFGSASPWTLKTTLALLQDNRYWCSVATSNGGGSDGSPLGATTPVARDTERSGNCAPPGPALAAPARTLSGTVTKYYYFGAQRVAMRTASGVTYLHGGHLGSTSVTSGANSSTQTYYPFGTVRTTSGTLPTDYTFTGQKLDASTGLMYYGARYYDAAIGRFAQPDSIVPNPYNPQSLNRYSYVYNNPVRYYDSDGHCFPFCIAAFAAQRVMPRELSAAGSRFVANLAIPLVSDLAKLDAANADNLWQAVNGDKIGLSTDQRLGAYGTALVGQAVEGALLYVGVEAATGAVGAAGACLATNCANAAGPAGQVARARLAQAIQVGGQSIESVTDPTKISSQLMSKAEILGIKVSGNMGSLANPTVDSTLNKLNAISSSPTARIFAGTLRGRKVYEYIEGGIGVMRDQVTGELISIFERPDVKKLEDFVEDGLGEWLR